MTLTRWIVTACEALILLAFIFAFFVWCGVAIGRI